MVQKKDKSYPQKKNEENVRNYRPILYSASVVQTVFDHPTDFILGLTKFNQRSRNVPSFLPNAGSLSDIQDDLTEMLRVGCQNVDCDDRFHESFRLH